MPEFKKILVLGGTHGCEPQSTYIVEKLAQDFKLERNYSPAIDTVFSYYSGATETHSLIMIPDLNRDGLENNSRVNARQVDLNRNMPSSNWSPNYSNQAYYPGDYPNSEKETKALVKILEANKFDLILSIHTNHFVVNPNPPQVNFDGPKNNWGHNQAIKLSEILELPLTDDIGYPTPGSMGSYASDKAIPCITLEIDDKYDGKDAWAKYGADLIKFIAEAQAHH